MADAFRLGVFGGAFDPPHRAHRALAQAALAQLGLDELRVLPTGQAWHKARALSDAAHRLAMCELTFGDLPRVRIDDRETRRIGATYTIDTLAELRAEHPGAALFLLVGEDQAQAFKTWRRWADILAMATLVVAARPAAEASAASAWPADLPHQRLSMALDEVSATSIRAQAARPGPGTDPLRELVVPAVAGYISQHHLYQTAS